MTTEHFNVQTARASTISETNGRASVFLGSVSAGLVALAFAGQTSRTALYTFGLILFPVLSFLGLVTFDRALQASIDDTAYVLRINRIRRFYVEAAPLLAHVLAPPARTDEVAAVLRTEGFRPGRWQLMLSIVGAIGVINSVLLGVTAGIGGRGAHRRQPVAATSAGVVAFAAVLALHQRHQGNARLRARTVSDPFTEFGLADV